MKQLSEEQKKLLNAPLPKEAVKPHPTKSYLSSIKAIYVVERLNQVFGLGGWEVSNTFVERDGKQVVVKSTFEAKEYGITIRDIFGGNDNSDLGDAYKGACTDALTKIGSYLGIGMDVYKGLADKNDSKGTTSYNHKKLDTPEKPLIPNGALKKAIERVRAGEKGVYEKVLSTYSLDPTQKSLLDQTKLSLNGQHA
jgi:hypothetical protein